MRIAIDQIIPDPDQPRKTFKEETLYELKSSYGKLGLIQPITVRPCNGKYQIVIGERRYRASLLNGQEEIECIVREDIDDRIAKEMQFAENSQQEDIAPLELGKAFLEHRRKYGLNTTQLALIVGISRQHLERLEDLVLHTACKTQEYLQSGKLDASTAYEISTIKDEKRQTEFADLAVKEDLSRSEVRQLKPKVEAQRYRPVESIFTSHRQQQLKQEPAQPTETQRLIHAIEQPIKLIELKMAMEQVIVNVESLDLDILSKLNPIQKTDLNDAIIHCIETLKDFSRQLTTAELIEGEIHEL